MNEKKKTGVIAIAALTAVLFFAIGSAQAVEVQRYFDDVEGGIAGWTEETIAGVQTDSLWHITETRANSPTHSWWYGQEATGNYDTGIPNSGCLVSPVISLNGDATAATLDYWTWWRTEYSSKYDLKKVYVRPTGAAAIGTCIETLPGGESPTAGGEIRTLDLSAYIGGDVQILFCFNTGDAVKNAYDGWFVDDIEVLVNVSTPPPPLEGISVNKTIWNNITKKWTDAIECAQLGENYTFRCEISNTGDVNLTNGTFWDIMTCSLEYVNNSARMKLPGEDWQGDLIFNEENVFKQKLLHSIDYVSGDPTRTDWLELHPGDTGDIYQVEEWHDNGDGNLTHCDQINMTAIVGDTWYHVDNVTYTLNTINATGDTWYFDSVKEYDYAAPNVTATEANNDMEWWKVCPGDCPNLNWSKCTSCCLVDRGVAGILDNGDTIRMTCDDETDECYDLQENVTPDIWVSREYLLDDLSGGEETIEPGESVTIEFNATVVQHGLDNNTQCAKARNETGWVHAPCDKVSINAPVQRVYFVSQDTTTNCLADKTVELWVDACGLKSGQVDLDYDAGCFNVDAYAPNIVDFQMNKRDSSPVFGHEDWFTFATDDEAVPGMNFLIGTLTIGCDGCVGGDVCDSDLDIDWGDCALYTAYGTEIAGVAFENGHFACTEYMQCGDVNEDGAVTYGDVGALHNHVTYDTALSSDWAGDVNCDLRIDMGDVGLLDNCITHGGGAPPCTGTLYELTCCAP